MTHEPSALSRLAERFILQMQWSVDATEMDKLLAIGNVRGFVAWIDTLPQDDPTDAEEAVIDAAWKRYQGAGSAY